MKSAGNLYDQNAMGLKNTLYAASIIFIFICFSYILFNFLNMSVYLISLCSIAILINFIITAKKEKSKPSRIKQYVGILLIIMTIPFWIIYNQIFSTFMLFAQQNLNLTVLSVKLEPGNILFFDIIGVLIVSPIIVKLYKSLEKIRINLSIIDKFTIGQICTGASVLTLALACSIFGKSGNISVLWMAPVFILFTIGEVLISALGLAMISLYFPNKVIGYAMGTWFLALAIGGILTGKIASLFIAIPQKITQMESMHMYIKYFLQLGVYALLIGLGYIIISIFIKRKTKNIMILP